MRGGPGEVRCTGCKQARKLGLIALSLPPSNNHSPQQGSFLQRGSGQPRALAMAIAIDGGGAACVVIAIVACPPTRQRFALAHSPSAGGVMQGCG